MGSMRDKLGDDLPTIGDSRRGGMSTLPAHGAATGLVSLLSGCSDLLLSSFKCFQAYPQPAVIGIMTKFQR